MTLFGKRRWTPVILVMGAIIQDPLSVYGGVLENIKGQFISDENPITLKDAACLVDCIDKELAKTGIISIKTPDVWGQNRMTRYRAEYETQMAKNIGSFQTILQGAQRRSDTAVLTSATSLAATVAATTNANASRGLLGRTRPAAAAVPTNSGSAIAPTQAVTVNHPASAPAAGGTGNSSGGTPSDGSASPDNSAADPTSLLADISAKLGTLQNGLLPLPTNISNFTTKEGTAGVGLEPTLQLDEEADYINHLHQLRRVNAGDDMTDMAGYGLYLLRMPISLMPGSDTRQGKGAIVTMEARHSLTDDLLRGTFRDSVIMDLTYALTQILNEEVHVFLCHQCNEHQKSCSQTPQQPCPSCDEHPQSPSTNSGSSPHDMDMPRETRMALSTAPIERAQTNSGPRSAFPGDLKIILGHTDWPRQPVKPSCPVHHNHTSTQRRLQNPRLDHRVTQSGAKQIIQNESSRKSSTSVIPVSLDTGDVPPTPSANMPGTVLESLPNTPPLQNNGEASTTNESSDDSQSQHTCPGSYLKNLGPSLQGTDNRLRVLFWAINRSQQDPARHDPSTLSILQGMLLDTYRFISKNASAFPYFQPPAIEKLGQYYLRRDFKSLIKLREEFLQALVSFRNGVPVGQPLLAQWEDQLTPTDILAFALMLQFFDVDRLIKHDMEVLSVRQKLDLSNFPLESIYFYDLCYDATMANEAFKAYVAAKWPLHVYSVDPVLQQQNILDAFSRRSELQLALAASVAAGKINIKNATSYARQLDLDLETVGLNRTSVGFGAGDTTFGWMFYPRVQTPPSQSNPRRIASLLYWNGPSPDYDLKHRRIEPGQRECIALILTPDFIPALRLNAVANWFDISKHCSHTELSNGDMLEFGHKLQRARNALTRICDSREYRAKDFVHIEQRINQLDNLLPTQDFLVSLPDEGDLLGSEIFDSNSSTLSPSLLAWYGESPQVGSYSMIFLVGRGFSVYETRVIVGGVDVPPAQRRQISRNVMEIVIPTNARPINITCKAASYCPPDSGKDDGTTPPVTSSSQMTQASGQTGGATGTGKGSSSKKTTPLPPCRVVFDVHVATPNGVSNHLYVEANPKPAGDDPSSKTVSVDTTTTTTYAPNSQSTSTHFETSQPGVPLPALTVLPLGTHLPPNSVLAPGTVTPAPKGSVLPGMFSPADSPAASQPPVLTPGAVTSGTTSPTSTPASTGTSAAPTAVPAGTPAATPPTANPPATTGSKTTSSSPSSLPPLPDPAVLVARREQAKARRMISSTVTGIPLPNEMRSDAAEAPNPGDHEDDVLATALNHSAEPIELMASESASATATPRSRVPLTPPLSFRPEPVDPKPTLRSTLRTGVQSEKTPRSSGPKSTAKPSILERMGIK